jgi:hypothetical protein
MHVFDPSQASNRARDDLEMFECKPAAFIHPSHEFSMILRHARYFKKTWQDIANKKIFKKKPTRKHHTKEKAGTHAPTQFSMKKDASRESKRLYLYQKKKRPKAVPHHHKRVTAHCVIAACASFICFFFGVHIFPRFLLSDVFALCGACNRKEKKRRNCLQRAQCRRPRRSRNSARRTSSRSRYVYVYAYMYVYPFMQCCSVL